jgi:hypothetical protein
MKKLNPLVLFTALIFIGNICCKPEKGDCHKTISFINNSEKAIYVSRDTHYPDTLYFGHFSSPALNSSFNKILGEMSSDRPLQNRDCWEDDFDYDALIPSDTLMVYVFDAQVLESVPWSTVVHDYLVLKRYDLSLSDLVNMNWTIIYP